MQASIVKKSSTSKKSVRSSRRGTSPVHTRGGARKGKSKSPAKSHRYTETELNNYMNKVVDRHFDETRDRVAADLSTVSDCVYLNKFNNMANSDLVNPALMSPSRRVAGAGGDEATSPERLRERYGGRTKSPSTRARPDMTSLLMDTETRRYVNEYKNQLKYLQGIVYNLDLKLREQETWQREVNNLRGEVDKGNNSREELRKTLMETTQELKEEAFKFNTVILELESHNSKILGDLKNANNTVDDLQTRLHAVEVKNAQLENENNELGVKLRCADIYKTQLSQSRNDYIAAEQRHADALKSLGDKVRALDAALSSIQQERSQLLSENRQLKEKVNNLANVVEEERNNNRDLQGELDNLRKKLQVSETACELLKSIQQQRDSIFADLNKVRAANENFQAQIGELEKDVIERSRDIESMERRNKDDLNRAQRRIRTLEDDLNNFKNNNIDLKKNNSELKNHITSLEQLLCVKEDVFSQLQDANTRVSSRTLDCDNLRAQIDANGKVTEGLNDKVMELEKCLIYLKNVVSEKDDYIVNLKKLVLELKGRSATYVPVTDDGLDKALAQYINASTDPNKLTTLFIRERDGVYQFGSKRVYVKMEGGKIFIRVGGGFLHLDEFLRINVPIELEKMAKRDPVSVLTRSLAVNKVVAGRNVGPNETSRISPLTYKNALNWTQAE